MTFLFYSFFVNIYEIFIDLTQHSLVFVSCFFSFFWMLVVDENVLQIKFVLWTFIFYLICLVKEMKMIPLKIFFVQKFNKNLYFTNTSLTKTYRVDNDELRNPFYLPKEWTGRWKRKLCIYVLFFIRYFSSLSTCLFI
jgi:hypothetical protein